MNFLIGFLLYLILGGLGSMYLPWWIIVPIGLAIGYFFKGKSGFAFLLGLGSQLLLWGGATIWISSQNNGLLMEKMSNLFGGLSPVLLILVMALIGGLTGGMSSWCGNVFRNSSTS